MKPRTVVVDLTGERHRVVDVEADPRVVVTACGIRVALGGQGHPRPRQCPREGAA